MKVRVYIRIPCFGWAPLAIPGSRDALGCHCMLLLRRVLRERLRLSERRVSSLPLLSTIWQNSVTVLVSFSLLALSTPGEVPTT